MAAAKAGRVLSIQSHVVHGHVGNKVRSFRHTAPASQCRSQTHKSTTAFHFVGMVSQSAIFPMQLLGLEVDPVRALQPHSVIL
eukprot:COSAG02_NODE_9295_length_2264_cov_1.382910_3_plen_83_part_00